MQASAVGHGLGILIRRCKHSPPFIYTPMHKLQVAAEPENGGAQRIEAAHVVEGAPAAITDANCIEDRRLFTVHAKAAEIAWIGRVPSLLDRQQYEIPE